MARMLAPTELLAQSPSRLARKRLQHASGEDQLKTIPLAELARACMADQDVYIGRHRWWAMAQGRRTQLVAALHAVEQPFGLLTLHPGCANLLSPAMNDDRATAGVAAVLDQVDTLPGT